MELKKCRQIMGLSTLLILASCGGSSTTNTEVNEADSSQTVIIEAADHTLDSTLLAAYQDLNGQILNIDSLLYNLHLIELSDDSLLQLLVQDSSGQRSLYLIDSIINDTTAQYQAAEEQRKKEEAEEAARVADSLASIKKVDPNEPPSGQVEFYDYHLFTASQPSSAKPLSSFPKDLIGTYYNTSDRNIELQITASTMIYRTDKQEILMLLSDKQAVKEDKGDYFFNFNVDVKGTSYWVTDRVNLEKDTLYFRTIYPNDMSKNPSKKEFRSYLKDNKTAIINSFYKLP